MANLSNLSRVFKKRYEFRGRRIYYDYRLFMLDIFTEGSIGAEIGVYIGGFSKHIIKTSKPKELYLIDPWPSEMLFYCFLQTYIHELLNKGTEITAVRDTFENAFKNNKVQKDYFDWVYLDTNHDYESTVEQLKICRQLVKNNGLITGDDYDLKHWPGVVRAVDEFVKLHGLKHQIKNRQFILENYK